jgi:isoleucyl-tRNA synthetase
VRLNRKRYWAGEMTTDKLSAYQTLYTCLDTIARLMAPIAPFYADRLFCDLNQATGRSSEVSVHLTLFPTYNQDLIQPELETRMDIAQRITSFVLALRKKESLKVRQPLSHIMIPSIDATTDAYIQSIKDIVMSEVNVKDIKLVDGSNGILVKRIKPDFKKLGPKCGKNMKQVAAALQNMEQAAIAQFEKEGQYTFAIEGQDIVVSTDDVAIFSEDIPGWSVANDGNITIALDITLTDELINEGIARELINRIQNIRKSSGLEITDRIQVSVSGNEAIEYAISQHKAYIASQVLAQNIVVTENLTNATEVDFDGVPVFILVEKI